MYDAMIHNEVDTGGINEELVCLYADLDRMIERCNFTKRQKEILDLYMMGYNEQDISEELNLRPDVVEGIIRSICRKIKRENDLAWKYDFVYWSKVKTTDKWKQCSRCKRWLPATEEFFSPDKRNSDGLQGICKKCDLSRKNTVK
jgi:DNA-binding CsgD family transcriptional regulator